MKTKLSRALSMLMALALILTLIPGAAFGAAAEEAAAEPVQYTITAAEAGHGSLSVNKKTAEAGVEVKVTVKADQFYKLDKLTIVREGKTKALPYASEGGGVYSFTMPNSNVNISATFVDNSVTIASEITGKGTFSATGGSTKTNGRATPGETITVYATPDAPNFYKLGSISVKTASGADVELTASPTPYIYTFKMPSENVTVSVNYEDMSAERAAWFNEDGSLKPGTYTVDTLFGKECYINANGYNMLAAMGGNPVKTQMTFTVKEDGSVHVDNWATPSIQNPLGYAGFGEVKISGTQKSYAKKSYVTGDDAGDVNETNYPVTLKISDVLSWYSAPLRTGERTPYDGDVYKVLVHNEKWLTSAQEDGYIYMKEDKGQIPWGTMLVDLEPQGQVFPAEISFDLPDTVKLKNTNDLGDRIIFVSTYPEQMGYYTRMMMTLDFATITKAAPAVADGVYTVPVTLRQFGDHSKESMGNPSLVQQAKVTVKDGKASIALTFQGMSLGTTYGHLTNLWVYPAADINDDPVEVKSTKSFKDKGLSGEIETFPRVFEFDRETVGEDEILVRVKADAMGDARQPAILVFDWDKATPGAPEEPADPVFPVEPETKFVDVPDGIYYHDPVYWAVGKEITNGMDATHFVPDGVCTRAQLVTFLWRYAGSPEPEKIATPFTDIDVTSWYGKAVIWATEKGIVKGMTETTFEPNTNVDRAQAITMLYRFAAPTEKAAAASFTDVPADIYYAEPVAWGAANKIVTGMTDTTFEPNTECTRAQAVTFIYRLAQSAK